MKSLKEEVKSDLKMTLDLEMASSLSVLPVDLKSMLMLMVLRIF